MTITFIYMDGCPACDAAKPVLKKWAKANRHVAVKWHNALKDKWNAEWQIAATPTYVLAIPGFRETMYEGAMSENDITRFIEISKQSVGAP
jgi:thiol-disulfide isomerase/thioredoxin